jgi:hypothetical protein
MLEVAGGREGGGVEMGQLFRQVERIVANQSYGKRGGLDLVLH